ncbi:hypothetical protein [Sporosalibacterium faouarense]|uniref:hypothetical protein n=1 Tax=Sporosalibacterium faouarense TaxID=516123 RepID=UPI00192C65D6|nr:hypothetical protein [Sporosalibacterium faouarense]
MIIIKKLVVGLVIMPVIILVIIISLFFVSPIINNISLNNFAKQLNKDSLPRKTNLVDKDAVCGKLNGNGNGMDFFACILIESELSLEELDKHYKVQEFNTARKSGRYNVRLDIIHANGYMLKTEHLEHQDVYFESLKNIDDYSGYYVVIIYDGGYPTYFDLRGN